MGSLDSLIKKASGGADAETGGATKVDEHSEEKLGAARAAIIERMSELRPRFRTAFETVVFAGNTIRLTVPSQGLKEELHLSRTEILDTIADIAKIDGALDLDIEVREVAVKMRPVRLEDRMRHIESRTPKFEELKKALDLEVE